MLSLLIFSAVIILVLLALLFAMKRLEKQQQTLGLTRRELEEKERFQQLAEATFEGILVHENNRIINANQALVALSGYSLKELSQLKTLKLIAPEMRRFARQNDLSELSVSYEVIAVRKDRTRIPVEIYNKNVWWEGRQVKVTAVRDISERKQVEEALRESERPFRMAFDSAALGVLIISPDGHCLEVNPAFCELLGYSERELLGSNMRQLTNPDDWEWEAAYAEQQFDSQKVSYQIEKRYLHKSGRQIWANTSVARVRDENGSPLYFVSQVQDITRQKLQDEQLQEYTREIEGKNIELDQALISTRDAALDDNKTNRIILQKMLKNFGCQADLVADGKTALQMLSMAAASGSPYDLFLLDMQMPQMNGIEVAHLVRADRAVRQTAMILLTSMVYKQNDPELQRVGFAACLNKPIKQSQLFDVMNETVNQVEDLLVETEPVPDANLNLPPQRKAKILLVEDNVVNQRLALKVLQRSGHEVSAVSNGRLACEAVDHAKFDLILMDVQMPEMDGYEATAAIRARQGTMTHTPIVAMTAHAMAGDREKCLHAGMDDYITKPLKLEQLKAVIEQWAFQQSEPEKIQAEIKAKDPIDLPALLRTTAGDEEFMRELIELFLADAPQRMTQLQAAVESGAADDITSAAHNLKGSSGNLSAPGLQEVFAQLEKQGATGELTEVRELFQIAELELIRVSEFLQKVARGI